MTEMSTTEKSTAETSEAGTGRVVRVTGPVVDVEFPADQVPQLFNALTVEIELEALRKTMTRCTSGTTPCGPSRYSRRTAWCGEPR
jgi:hypothetical protein